MAGSLQGECVEFDAIVAELAILPFLPDTVADVTVTAAHVSNDSAAGAHVTDDSAADATVSNDTVAHATVVSAANDTVANVVPASKKRPRSPVRPVLFHQAGYPWRMNREQRAEVGIPKVLYGPRRPSCEPPSHLLNPKAMLKKKRK
jgi:hypothetical protein